MIDILSQVNTKRLQEYVNKIEGLRHGWENYAALEQRAAFIEDTLKSFPCSVENQEFLYHERTYRNIVATLEGLHQEKERILLGAHYDAAWAAPGLMIMPVLWRLCLKQHISSVRRDWSGQFKVS